MAMNLRLRDDAAEALRAEAERSGLSQQEILRRAVDAHLGIGARAASRPLPDWEEPPTQPLRRATVRLNLPDGVTSRDLIDREDRV